MTVRVCSEPGCPTLHPNPHGKCDTHKATQRAASRARNPRKGNPHATRAWRAARRRELDDAGWRCRDCGKPTRQVDHLNGDSADHRPENLRARCQSCHSSKTATHDQHRGPDGRFQGQGPRRPTARRRGARSVEIA